MGDVFGFGQINQIYGIKPPESDGQPSQASKTTSEAIAINDLKLTQAEYEEKSKAEHEKRLNEVPKEMDVKGSGTEIDDLRFL